MLCKKLDVLCKIRQHMNCNVFFRCQWNHAAFADDLSIYVCTVRDANKLLDEIHEFEFWSGLWISILKSLATGAIYGTGTTRRQEGAKADAAKRKRDAGPDILNPQIQALEAMDE